MTQPAVGKRADSAVAKRRGIRVWDPLVRIIHWSLAAAFFGAWWLSDGAFWHQALGYTALGLIGFRLVWGLAGSPHARFANFVPRPGKFIRYLRDMLLRREARHLGHNPAGAAMILALLAAIAVTGVSGWLMTTDALWGVAWVQELHAWAADATLVLVGLHVAGVIYASWRHREDLVLAMFTGRKRAAPPLIESVTIRASEADADEAAPGARPLAWPRLRPKRSTLPGPDQQRPQRRLG